MEMTEKELMYWKHINQPVHDCLLGEGKITSPVFSIEINKHLKGFSDLVKEEPSSENLLHVIIIKKYSSYKKIFIYNRNHFFSDAWICKSIADSGGLWLYVNEFEYGKLITTEGVESIINEESKDYDSIIYKYSESLRWLDKHAVDVLKSGLICDNIRSYIFDIDASREEGSDYSSNLVRLKFNIDLLKKHDPEGAYINHDNKDYLFSNKEKIKSLLKELRKENDSK